MAAQAEQRLFMPGLVLWFKSERFIATLRTTEPMPTPAKVRSENLSEVVFLNVPSRSRR